MLGHVEICLMLFIQCLNKREGFKWTRAKVKQPLKGFSFFFFLFLWCVCVAIFFLVIIINIIIISSIIIIIIGGFGFLIFVSLGSLCVCNAIH